MVTRICEDHQIPCNIQSYDSGEDCMKNLHLMPDVILLEFYLDARNDITSTAYDLLSDIHDQVPGSKLILISRQEDWSLFKDDLISAGADEFLHKDKDLAENLDALLGKVFSYA